MIDKNKVPTKLLWVDLEMTGLDATNDVILEVYAEITDFDFKVLSTYEARIKQDKSIVKRRMQENIWWQDFPENRDHFLQHLGTGKDLDAVESELLVLVAEHFGSDPVVLAGNSIHADRKFIAQYMPKLDGLLHYRMLDVSALKILMQGKYGVSFNKKETHRARDDIQESIAELKHYLEWFSSAPA